MIYIIEAINRFFTIDSVWIILSLITGITTHRSLKDRKKSRLKSCIYAGLLVAYSTLVLSYTLFSRTPTGNIQFMINPLWAYKLIPFDPKYKMDIILNYMLFIPFGFLMPKLLKHKNRYIKTVFISFLFSLFIELMQLVTTTGLFETTDLLGNTIGAAIGAFIYFVIRKITLATIRNKHQSYQNHYRRHSNNTNRQHKASYVYKPISSTKPVKTESKSTDRINIVSIRQAEFDSRMSQYDEYIKSVDNAVDINGVRHAHNFSYRKAQGICPSSSRHSRYRKHGHRSHRYAHRHHHHAHHYNY